MPTFRRDGIAFHYTDRPADPGNARLPFLFQHGIGGTLAQPTGLLDPVPPGIRLISMDARGHGATWPLGPPERLTFDDLADDLVALMDHLELPEAVVGGISMGAGTALTMALRHPARVTALVLSRPAWLDGPMVAADIYGLIAQLLCDHGSDEGLRRFTHTPEHRRIARESPDAAASLRGQFTEPRAVEALARLELLPHSRPLPDIKALHSVRVPALVMATGSDPVHPLEYGHALAEAIPRARLCELTPKSTSTQAHREEALQEITRFLCSIDSI
ncbi:alpha/beta fold hydrolase [Streptomyces sp. TRM66268-LWL]|uniref:Alpha/beta fold hydrolase n=1 Tax=Streptomyces polyasparticus TaxID=2767826 RepID=A0ABR7SVD9_9ACTN|nr:alpha/beta fold hydrolase [Streptomyces polyasparticus]MBC9719446.1 alpha/beta fold hydrolase [Streptomyces polyasparticus]